MSSKFTILPSHLFIVCFFINLNLQMKECLAEHSSYPSPLLSRSCRTECAAWHSYTSQTLLLSALWWTRPLPDGRPVSPKQTALSVIPAQPVTLKEETVINFEFRSVKSNSGVQLINTAIGINAQPITTASSSPINFI